MDELFLYRVEAELNKYTPSKKSSFDLAVDIKNRCDEFEDCDVVDLAIAVSLVRSIYVGHDGHNHYVVP